MSASSSSVQPTLLASPPGDDEASEDLASWRARISARQAAATSPERRRELAERRERCRALVRQGEQTARVSAVSRAAFLGSCSSISATGGGSGGGAAAAAAAAQPTASSSTALAAFGAAAAPQSAEQSRRRTAAAAEAMRTLQWASAASSVEEGDRHIDSALDQLALAGYSFAADRDRGGAGVEAAAELADESVLDLLGSLKEEPSTDQDRAARFALYERHAETVAAVRDSLIRFWRSAAEEVTDPAPRAAIDDQIRKIDERSNLELHEDRRYWFVYSMAVATTRNEAAIQAVLRAIQTKIVLLAEGGHDCPICLEPILVGDGDEDNNNASSVALGCAHRLHADCWRHWSAHCASVRLTPFCPTCRNEEFLQEIL